MKCRIQVVFGPYSYEDMVLQPGNPKRYFGLRCFHVNYFLFFWFSCIRTGIVISIGNSKLKNSHTLDLLTTLFTQEDAIVS